ncbi:MAG: TolC family protein [Bacteroidales bacterium]|nr:TolC family protein [Bacteroidales bacterium]
MNSSKVLFWGMALASLVSMPVMAQEKADSVTMNLDQVLEVALTDNPSIQVANRTIETQKYAKKESIIGLFPTVSVSAAGVKNVKVATMVMAMGDQVIKAKMGRPYNYTLQGTAAMPLIAPQLWKSIQLSEEQVALAVEQARESKVQTISQVKEAFYSLLLARDSYAVLQSGYELAKKNANVTNHAFEVGSVSEYDKLTAEVQVTSIEPLLFQAKNGIELAEMSLKVLMGIDVKEPIKFEGNLSDYEEMLFDELMKLKADTDLDSNSTLRQLDLQRNQLVLAEKINKLGYWPTLALQFGAGYQAMPDKFNPFDADYYGSSSLTLALSWTLWDGGAKLLKSKKNRLSVESLDIQRENVKKQLELGIQSSLTNIETAAEQVVSHKKSLYSAERAYEIAEIRYEAGSGTIIELNASENSLMESKLQYVQAIYDFMSYRASLEETLGKALVQEK